MPEVSEEQQERLSQTAEAHVHDLRRRLLDLRIGNRLLHFPHAARGRNYVRVVDELPELLHKKLLDGRSLRVLPLPEAPGAAPSDVVAEAGPELGGTLSVEQLALRAGIDPSYALPAPSVDAAPRPRRHGDDALQTLLPPELHQKTLARIADLTRSSQEEQGIHTLFAAFGFLEWYEQGEHKDAPRYAPLLLFPLKLQRERKQGRYEYAISAHDEEAEVNLVLSERLLRDTGLALPGWQDEDELADYFARVTHAIGEHARWKLHRWVTLSNFSFARIAMYQDLEADGWPPAQAPHAHPTFRALTVDRTREAGSERLDDADAAALAELADRMPSLVLDADSTQVAAIMEAMQARNLVIEGPPGTGKSQTIANLIATALAAGQRVLFVAEKLAALEVVKARLDRAGIGAFCLELHSHRGTRKAVLEALGSRLELRTSTPRELSAQRERSAALRAQLDDYAEALNAPAGALSSSVHTLIWQRELCRDACRSFLPALETLRVSHVASLREPELDAVRHQLRGFMQNARDRSRAFVGQTSSLWSVLQLPASSDEAAAEPSEEGLLKLHERVRETLGAVRDALVSTLGTGPADALTTPQVEALEALLRALPAEVPLRASLLERLGDASARRTLSDAVQLLERRASSLATLAQRCGDLRSASNALGPLREALLTLTRLGSGGTLAAARAGACSRSAVADELTRAAPQLAELLRFAGLHDADDAETLLLLEAALETLHESPREVWRALRLAPALTNEHAAMALRKLASEGQALRQQRDALDRRIVRGRGDAELRERASEYALALRRPWWLAWLFRVFWAARALHTRVAREPGRPARQMADELLEAAQVLDALARYEARSDGVALCGGAFQGVDTDFDLLLAASSWAAAVQARFSRMHPAAAIVRQLLLQRDVAEVDTLLQEARQQPLEPLWQLAARAKQHAVTLSAALARERAEASAALSALDTLAAVELEEQLSLASVASTLDELSELSRIEAQLDDLQRELALLGLADDARELELAQLALTQRAADQAVEQGLPTALLATVAEPARRAAFLLGLRGPLERLAQAERSLAPHGASGSIERLRQQPIPGALALLQQAIAARPLLRAQLRYLRELQRVRCTFAAPVVEAALRGEVPLEQLVEACDFLLYGELLLAAAEHGPALREQNGRQLDSIRAQYRALDREILALQARDLASTLARAPVAEGIASGKKSEWSELSLIKHERSKKMRHLPLRQLVRRAGTALGALKPCFMMSPLTVAQFLPQLANQFDLLVIDEASQMRPEEALGALLRATRAVVVGDPKQLPPTPFFQRLESADEESDAGDARDRDEAIDQESILDLAVASFGDTRALRWHYRSRHPSLIAFSNQHFYDGRLMVFPAPLEQRDNRGVLLVPVQGAYQSSLNPLEAERIALGVQRHVRVNPQLTLGVVAMNQQQKELIRQKIDELDDELVRAFVDAPGEAQPFFVKSLENVQGDERDVIFVSLTYGPDPVSKKVQQHFGPINGRYGARRLNVLFTRARERLVVFSSLRSEDVRAEPGAGAGLVALRAYLAYAEQGARLAPGADTGSGEGPFIAVVRGMLEQAGYQVKTRVGVQGFFVDLAVMRKDGGGASCGIECDGADYHAQRSVRDRDRLRHELLEAQGWTLVRVWSIDWLRAPEAARERLLREVERACSA
jgi:very-short-patch-repair endonuclease